MFFSIFDFMSYFSKAKDLSFWLLEHFLSVCFHDIAISVCEVCLRAVQLNLGSTPHSFWGLHTQLLLSPPDAFCPVLFMLFPGFISVDFFKRALSFCRRDREPKAVLREGLRSWDWAAPPRRPSHCPTKGPMWHCPSHLPAKEPLLAHGNLKNTEGHWVMKLQSPVLFLQVPCTETSHSTPRETSSKLANKFCSIPAYYRT